MKKIHLAKTILFLLAASASGVAGQNQLVGGRVQAQNIYQTVQQHPGRGQENGRGQGYKYRHKPKHTNPNLYNAPLPHDLEGKTWDRKKLEGKIVVLNFWATWCAPCLEQIPEVKKIYDKYSRDDLTILGVNLDSGGNRSLRRWLRLNRNRVTWPQLFNRGGFNGDLPGCYAVTDVPVLLVFNRQGDLAYRCHSAVCAREAVIELNKK